MMKPLSASLPAVFAPVRTVAPLTDGTGLHALAASCASSSVDWSGLRCDFTPSTRYTADPITVGQPRAAYWPGFAQRGWQQCSYDWVVPSHPEFEVPICT